MTEQRKIFKDRTGKNKTVCTSTVCEWFGVADQVHYLHCIDDVVRAVRKGGFTVRSRGSKFTGRSVGSCRDRFAAETESLKHQYVYGYLVFVDGHVLLVNKVGKTIVDTADRKRDRRKMIACYVVY